MTDEIGYSLAALSSFGAGSLFKARARTTIVKVHSGQVLPVIASGPVDAAPSQRFNRMIVGHARAGRIYRHLASPLAKLLMDKAEKTPAPLQVPVH
jgi:hypothetical protein